MFSVSGRKGEETLLKQFDAEAAGEAHNSAWDETMKKIITPAEQSSEARLSKLDKVE